MRKKHDSKRRTAALPQIKFYAPVSMARTHVGDRPFIQIPATYCSSLKSIFKFGVVHLDRLPPGVSVLRRAGMARVTVNLGSSCHE